MIPGNIMLILCGSSLNNDVICKDGFKIKVSFNVRISVSYDQFNKTEPEFVLILCFGSFLRGNLSQNLKNEKKRKQLETSNFAIWR